MVAVLSVKERIWPAVDNGLPLPPPELRQLVSSGRIFVRQHISIGQEDAANLVAAIDRHGMRRGEGGRILDFGCGCGRILRQLAKKYLREWDLYGCDIDPRLISWCRENLDCASFFVSSSSPPLDLAANSLDAVYLVSVFTHMDEAAQLAWLQEFFRLLKPGGMLLITVIPLSQSEMLDRWDHKQDDGFAYSYRRTEAVSREWVGEKDAHTFYLDCKHAEAYCRKRWSHLFEVLEFSEAAWAGKQALVVLRKS